MLRNIQISGDQGRLTSTTRRGPDQALPAQLRRADILAEASSGLLDDQDLADAASALADGCLGVLVVYENVWAAPFATDLRRAGAQLVASGRIPVNAILEALGTTD